MAPKKVCVIGAGPSGMNFLLHMQRFKQAGANNVPVVTCYENKSKTIGEGCGITRGGLAATKMVNLVTDQCTKRSG